ncbi:hypothetical protein N9L68_01700 [bacterium]|nr:hypothetical protein [bacterium]
MAQKPYDLKCGEVTGILEQMEVCPAQARAKSKEHNGGYRAAMATQTMGGDATSNARDFARELDADMSMVIVDLETPPRVGALMCPHGQPTSV